MKIEHVLGVLGLGEGRSIISAAQRSDRWEIGNICDLNEALCVERQREFGLPRYTTDYAEMLADEAIDTISIYTPDEFHASHCIQAFQAGKHVVCTKPLFDSLRQAAEVRRAGKEAGRSLFVGQSSRFYEPMMAQRADFETGKAGAVYSVEAHYHADHRWFYAKHKHLSGYKPLFGGLSHPVDLVRWYLGPIDEVFGYGLITSIGRELGINSPDAMHFVLRARDGRIGRVSGCYTTPTPAGARESHISCILRGEEGASQADYPELRYSTHFPGEGEVVRSYESKADHYFRFSGRTHHAGEFQNYLEYFADELDAGGQPKPDLDEGIITVATMTAMERCFEQGVPVRVADVLMENELGFLAG